MVTAIDVGASKTLVAQFHGSLPMHEFKFSTPRDKDVFTSTLKNALSRFPKIELLSIGVPGIIDHNGLIVRCANLPWRDFDLKKILSRTYSCPVFIDNDAKLAGLAEVNSLKQTPRLGLYITISTGIGVGAIENGKISAGLRFTEPGHMVLNRNSVWQEWEEFASGRAILKKYGLAKDITSEKTWQTIADDICVGLLALIPTLQPEVIIFGGSVGTYFNSFGSFLNEKLDRRLPTYITRPVLLEAQHPDEAVIYGCYYNAEHQINFR